MEKAFMAKQLIVIKKKDMNKSENYQQDKMKIILLDVY